MSRSNRHQFVRAFSLASLMSGFFLSQSALGSTVTNPTAGSSANPSDAYVLLTCQQKEDVKLPTRLKNLDRLAGKTISVRLEKEKVVLDGKDISGVVGLARFETPTDRFLFEEKEFGPYVELMLANAAAYLGAKTVSVYFVTWKNFGGVWGIDFKWDWKCKNETPQDVVSIIKICEEAPDLSSLNVQCKSKYPDPYGLPEEFTLEGVNGVDLLAGFQNTKGANSSFNLSFIPTESPGMTSAVRYIEYCAYGHAKSGIDTGGLSPLQISRKLIETGKGTVLIVEHAGDGGSYNIYNCQ